MFTMQHNMWMDVTKHGFDAQNYIKRYGNFKYWLYYSSLLDYAEEMKIHWEQQVVVYSLAIIVSVNNFQAPEIQAVLSSSFVVTVIILKVE